MAHWACGGLSRTARTKHVASWRMLRATLPTTRRAKPGWLSPTVGLARTCMAIGRAGPMSRPSSRSTAVKAESATASFEDSSCSSRRPAEQRTTRRDLRYLSLMQSLTCRPLMRSLDAPSVDAISRWFSARPLRVNDHVATRRLRAVGPNGSIARDIRTPDRGPWQRCERADDRKLVRRQVFAHDVGEVKQRGPRPQGCYCGASTPRHCRSIGRPRRPPLSRPVGRALVASGHA